MKKILIIDDHEVVREGVKRILAEQNIGAIWGEARSTPEALRLVREQEWDVALLDLSLAGRNGLELLKEIKQIRPRLPVLILTMHSEEQYARRAFKSGAAGYITKDGSRSELLKAVHTVAEGGRYVSSAFVEQLVMDLGRDPARPSHETLSDREFEVMHLIAAGKTIGEIAQLLCLSDKTISTYRARILQKMGMRTSAELTHYVIMGDRLGHSTSSK